VLAVLAVGALVYASRGDAGGTVWARLTSAVSQGGLGTGDARRTGLWQEGLAAFAARPATGYGPGAFIVADRLYGDAADRAVHPGSVASDAHSLPVELAATGGLPSLLLAIACGVALVWLSRPGESQGGEVSGTRGRPLAGRPARAYLLATLVYLLVSPLDLVVLAPAAVAAALLCLPLERGRFAWRLGRDGGNANRIAAALLGVASVVLLVTTIYVGQRAWRADEAFSDTARTRTWDGAARASALAPWEAFYALEAGARRWRSGLEAGDNAAVQDGKDRLERGVGADPTAADGYADLARLAIARGRFDEAVDQLRAGLRWNPHHPVLQGLWAVAAVTAQRDVPEVAAKIAKELESVPADTPDAWFWLGEYRQGRGDVAGARRARQEAARLAPWLSERRYEQRLLHSR
jgi:tetratricopeptide (TPR) repeat protein